MKSRYLYLVFILLGISVVAVIFVSFQYVNNPKTVLSDAVEASDMDDTTNMPDSQYIKNSWLGQVTKETNQKSYFYAVSEIQLELN